jgi:beta-lactam-binding protein with PASTA domain
MSFEPGELIGGRYELGRQLGAGGMARVYLGHDRLLDREVAVKVLAEPYASDPQFVERFRREASAAAGLNHPNIVAVYDRGEANGSYYIVMEYLSGPDLKQVIRRRAPLPPLQAIDFAQQILAALGAAHRRDVVHRDVKPQNVLVAEDGHLKVTDFGIARAGAQTDMTEAGSVIGTAQYLSPEQARGDEVTAASDCYAVGIVLYEMLTGRVPFDGDRPVAVAMKQISDEPASPRTVEPSVPPELESVVMRALAKRPSERYRTAGEFSRALSEARTALDGSGSTTSVMPAAGATTAETRVMDPVTGPTRVAPPPPDEPPGERRRRWPWVVAGIVLLAALAAAGFLLFGGDEARAVTIPSVAGQSAAEAQATLENAGLGVEVQRVTTGDVEAGQAIDTEPPEGSEVDEGDTVVLRVSGGPGLATVPDVEGDEEAAATAELQRADFEVDTRQEASGDVDEGVVISQSPDGGSQAEVGSTVTIVVSSGPETVSVPDVRQRSLDSAEATLNGAGLVVGNVTEEPSSSFAAGTVIRQDPGPTAQAAEGSAVDLVVASAPEQVTVPSIVGNTATDAQTKLQNAGFDVDTVEVASDEPAGTVVSSDPAEGTQVEPGSTITISVSLGSSGGEGDEGDEGGSLGGGGGSDPGSGSGGGAQPPPPSP